MNSESIVHGVYSGDDDDWQLELEFDSDNADFIRGFQAGQLWELTDYGLEEIETVIFAENVEMVMRIAESRGYTFFGEETLTEGFAGEYLKITLTKIKKRRILHPDRNSND